MTMLRHVLYRLCSTILLLLAVSFFTFWLMHATPGSFFDSLRLNPQISPETIARYENLYHLKDPCAGAVHTLDCQYPARRVGVFFLL